MVTSKNKISQHISIYEASCRCGCGQCYRVPAILVMYENFRSMLKDIMGYEIFCPIHCINRCKDHNAAVGGSDHSLHLVGSACDLHARKMPIKLLHEIAIDRHKQKKILTGGLGVYDWGVHVDIGAYRFWDERG